MSKTTTPTQKRTTTKAYKTNTDITGNNIRRTTNKAKRTTTQNTTRRKTTRISTKVVTRGTNEKTANRTTKGVNMGMTNKPTRRTAKNTTNITSTKTPTRRKTKVKFNQLNESSKRLSTTSENPLRKPTIIRNMTEISTTTRTSTSTGEITPSSSIRSSQKHSKIINSRYSTTKKTLVPSMEIVVKSTTARPSIMNNINIINKIAEKVDYETLIEEMSYNIREAYSNNNEEEVKSHVTLLLQGIEALKNQKQKPILRMTTIKFRPINMSPKKVSTS